MQLVEATALIVKQSLLHDLHVTKYCMVHCVYVFTVNY